MKECKHCGAENPDSSVYCVKCGNKMNREQEKEDNRTGIGVLLFVLIIIVGVAVSIGLIILAFSLDGWWSKMILMAVAAIWYGIITGKSILTGDDW